MNSHICQVPRPTGKGGRRVFDDAEERRIAERVLLKKEKRQAVADDLGCHRNTIANVLEHWKLVEEPSAPQPNSPDDKAASDAKAEPEGENAVEGLAHANENTGGGA